ncbi:MAG: hypothetical protein JWQ98_2104 [Chlorobi bacterium]|nr:hypothetical protein [Chlorobiota bacterium]
MNNPIQRRCSDARRHDRLVACAAIMLWTLALASMPANAQWQAVESPKLKGALLYGLDIPADTAIYAIGYNAAGRSAIYKSTDAGTVWSAITVPGMSLFDMEFVDASTGFVAGRGTQCGCPTVSRTTDGGAHWKLDTIRNAGGGIDKISASTGLTSFHFSSPDTGYVVGVGGIIAKTTNGGVTWHAETTGEAGDYFAGIAITRPGHGFALAAAATTDYVNQFYHSNDDGEHWTKISGPGENSSFRNVTFPTGDTGFLLGGDSTGAIYKTTDGGETWSRKYTGARNVDIFQVAFRDAMEGFAVGMSGTVLHTGNGGDTWTVENEGDSIILSDVAITSDMVYVIGPGGLFRRSLAQSGVESPARPTGRSIIITPNPLLDHAVIHPAALLPGSDYCFELHDLLGREVRKIDGMLEEKGIDLWRGNLGSGTYFYRLSAGNRVVGFGTVVIR